MPKFLLIASVVFIIAAAFFSFQTRSQIEKIVSDLKASKESLAATNKNLATALNDYKTTHQQLNDEQKKSSDIAEELSTTKGELTKVKSDLADSASKLTAANAQVDDLNQKLAAAKPSDPGASSIADVEAKLKEAETKLGELETVNKTLSQKNTDNESKLAGLEKAETARKGKILQKGLTGQVLAVNRSYNFLVISLGDKQGVVMNGEMVVKRGGMQVARVKITSVEPTTSIADIVPGTLGRGTSVQAGDEVIYPGTGI